MSVLRRIPFASFVLLLAFCVRIAAAQSDTQAPVLAGAPVVSPDTVILAGSSVSVTISVNAEDNSSGVASLSGYFFHPEGSVTASFNGELVSGTAQAGTWEGAGSVSQQNLPEGAYSLLVFLSDSAGNGVVEDIAGALYVSGGDDAAPTIEGEPTIEPPQIALTNGVQTVVVTVEAADVGTGVDEVVSILTNVNGSAVASDDGVLVGGDPHSGTWEVAIELDPAVINLAAPEGDLGLTVYVTDGAGNVTTEQTDVVLQLIRSRTGVTFQVDLRRLEQLGVVQRTSGIGLGDQVFVEIVGGPEAGSYELTDFDADSVWTTVVQMSHDQEIEYRFAVDPDRDGVDLGDWVRE